MKVRGSGQFFRLAWVMAMRDFKTRYAGAKMGWLWAIFQPLSMLLVYWLVFSYGLKLNPAEEFPFIVSFAAGLIPWLFFSDSLGASSQIVVKNAPLIKTMPFPSQVLPFSVMISSSVIHFALLFGFFGLMVSHSIAFSIFNGVFFLFFFLLILFTVGMSYLLASLSVFYKDMPQVLAVVLNLWFWLTPVVWSTSLVSEKLRVLLLLNPIAFIAEGYRSAFLYQGFSKELLQAAPWVITISVSLFLFSRFKFYREKSEFAGVL